MLAEGAAAVAVVEGLDAAAAPGVAALVAAAAAFEFATAWCALSTADW